MDETLRDAVLDRTSRTLAQAETLRMTVLVEQKEGLLGNPQPDTLLDVTMTKAGKLRIDASQQGMLVAQVIRDGESVFEFNRPGSSGQAQWTRYPVNLATIPLLIVDEAGQPKRSFAVTRFSRNWLASDSPYTSWLRDILAAGQPEAETTLVNGLKCDVIRVSQSQSRDGMTLKMKAMLAFDAESGMPVQEKEEVSAALAIVPAYYSSYVFTYQTTELNHEVPPDFFTFHPPQDAVFIDPAPLLARPELAVGAEAPPVSLADLEKKELPLASFYDKRPVLLVFWATWCMPCKQQLRDLSQYAPEKEWDEKLHIVAVSVDESDEVVRSHVRQNPLPFTVVRDATGARKAFGGDGVPVAFLIDTRGVVRGRWIGWSSGPPARKTLSEIHDALQSVLTE